MIWRCLGDRAPLDDVPDGSRLRCATCGAEHPVAGGIPVFASNGDGHHASPPTDELWDAMQHGTAEEAATAFAGRHPFSRSGRNADWKFFVPSRRDGSVLELGAGFGDDTVDLASAFGTAVAIVPDVTNARILARRIEESPEARCAIAVMRDLGRLPLADASIDAIVLEDVAAAGFALTNARLTSVAREWSRVLAPGGTVLLGVTSFWHALPGVTRLRERVRSRSHPESLNRQVKRWAGGGGELPLGRAGAIRAMARAGFRDPAIYAPIPDENETRIVIPAREKAVVRYFLNNLTRKNSPAVRAAAATADALISAGVFHRLLPYYYLIFRTGAAA